jgi:hypothetical protein
MCSTTRQELVKRLLLPPAAHFFLSPLTSGPSTSKSSSSSTEGQLRAGDGAGTMALLLLHLCLFDGVPKETPLYFRRVALGS